MISLYPLNAKKAKLVKFWENLGSCLGLAFHTVMLVGNMDLYFYSYLCGALLRYICFVKPHRLTSLP
jgi:hypothetical protein